MKRISKSDQVRAAKKLLAEEGYITDSLWSIEDVKRDYNVTDLEAMEILEDAIGNNDTLAEKIFCYIAQEAENRGLIKKE